MSSLRIRISRGSYSTEEQRKTNTDRKTIMEEKRKLYIQKRSTMGLALLATDTWVPPELSRNTLANLCRRHDFDGFHIDELFKEDLDEWVPSAQSVFDDDRDLCREPTFSKFRVPLEIRCLERYRHSKKKQAKQFKWEIKKLIENMPSAGCAWEFVRVTSYTTLWPPLHTREELQMFNKFFTMTPREQARFNKIMTTNIT
ncbi:uncharacterized protein [Drosophila bipectinata]|uniref:uncharacterized protein n=1 Tax=Drosophila bipectinata TaxID=42026 RepID=UPI001C8A0915|nr:uncharacterized protein LOC108130422 [Drosophila bipectinata]